MDGVGCGGVSCDVDGEGFDEGCRGVVKAVM